MPPTRSAARKATRSVNTNINVGALKATFKDVGKSSGLKAGKNVGANGVAAAKAAGEKSELVGVVVERKMKEKGKKVQKAEKEGEGGVIEVKEVKEVEKAVGKENVVEQVEKEKKIEETITVAVEKEVVIEVAEVKKSAEKPVVKSVEKPAAKAEKSTKSARGKKRKAEEPPEERPEEKPTEATNDVPTEKTLSAPAQSRKRTRLRNEPTTVTSTSTITDDIPPPIIPEESDSDYQEKSTQGKTPKTPRKRATIKSKTPRSTLNAKYLSIAASTLGQTTLNIPPTSTSEATLSSLNNLLTVPEKEKEKKRPAYLQHLINLHAHLLTAIHLHHAQNGVTSLPDLKGLKPHLERLSRRTVELGDLRRVCWITGYDPEEKGEEEIVEPEVEAEVEEAPAKKGRKGKKAAATKSRKSKAVKKEEEGKDEKKIPRGWLNTVDYGNGKIVLELVLSMAGVGEVNNLRKEFESRVDVYWKKLENEGKEIKEGEIVDIPMADIIISENKKMVDEVLKAKGQRRLLEMKGVRVLKGTGKGLTEEPLLTRKKAAVEKPTLVKEKKEEVKAEEESAETTATPTHSADIPATPTPQEKKLSLLDRIRAKHQASLAAAASSPTTSLTPEQIAANHARICAQQRLPEVIPILRSLRLRAGGGGIGGAATGRKSMSLDEVVLGIRQSVRSGITKDEAELCVRLAGEQGFDPTPKKPMVTRPVEKGVGGALSKFDMGSLGKVGLVGRDEKGWVEVVECGGVKAVVFK